MSVYVDNMRAQLGRMVMCHMFADTHEELVSMADTIGVQRRWIQHEGEPEEHFDIALSKRRLALEAGAQEATPEDLVRILRQRRRWVIDLGQGRRRRPIMASRWEGDPSVVVGYEPPECHLHVFSVHVSTADDAYVTCDGCDWRLTIPEMQAVVAFENAA